MSKEKQITETGFWVCKNPDIYKFDEKLADALADFIGNDTFADMGCGNGAYTKYLIAKGLTGVCSDGNPHTPEISDGLCEVYDLSKPMDKNHEPKIYDWVLCLEVAEHVPKQYESTLVENVKMHCQKGIIISWAIPGQGGHGHVNEKSNEYVRGLFDGSEYTPDIIAEEKMREAARLPWFKNSLMVFKKV